MRRKRVGARTRGRRGRRMTSDAPAHERKSVQGEDRKGRNSHLNIRSADFRIIDEDQRQPSQSRAERGSLICIY